MNNVIILTAGLTGSSLLVSLLETEGYWPGDQTKRKSDYDTRENSTLVEINEGLLKRYGFSYTDEFSCSVIEHVANEDNAVIKDEIRQFIAGCDKHSPWILKDPRLWATIRFWRRAVDFSDVKFLVLVRDDIQCWVSQIIRRQIQSLAHVRFYNNSINKSILNFLQESRYQYKIISYDELILKPEVGIQKINDFLGTNIAVECLEKLYRGNLYQRPRGLKDYLMACLIYIKNYRWSNADL